MLKKQWRKFKKKWKGPHDLRQKMNDEIKNNLKTPVLLLHILRDKYEGLLSDWLDEIEKNSNFMKL